MKDNILELIIMLHDINPHHLEGIKRDAATLQRLANKLRRYALQGTNGPPMTDKDTQQVAKLEDKVTTILNGYGLAAEFNDDPRGFAVYIHKPGIAHRDRMPNNDLGQRGLGI